MAAECRHLYNYGRNARVEKATLLVLRLVACIVTGRKEVAVKLLKNSA